MGGLPLARSLRGAIPTRVTMGDAEIIFTRPIEGVDFVHALDVFACATEG